MRRALALALALAALGGALALRYRVDPQGGPAGLAEGVQTALGTWSGVEGAQVEAETAPDAANLIRYGDATQMGPDTLSLTLSTRAQDSGLEVLVNPEAQELLPSVLLHETGLLLGLSPTTQTGAMDPAIAGAAAELSPPDEAAIVAQKTAAPEDVTGDGSVDFYDLAALAADFGRAGVNLAADINGDRVVDEKDLVLLQKAYVFGPPDESAPKEPAPTGGGELPPVPETGLPPVPPPAGGAATGGAGTGGAAGRTGGAATGGAGTGGQQR